MVALNPPVCDFGWKAVDFDLPATDGRRYSLDKVRGPNGLLVMFICNHCPYVKAVIDRIVRDCRELQSLGVGSVAIVPVFFGVGRHAREDLPRLVDEVRGRHPGLQVHVTPAVGEWDDLLDGLAEAVLKRT